MDKIIISDIKLHTRIGINDWEKQTWQHLHLDLALGIDAKHCAENDDIQATVDYDKVIQHIFSYVQTHHFQLIETLAEHLAKEILTNFATPFVQITLHKPGALTQAKDVAIILERHQ